MLIQAVLWQLELVNKNIGNNKMSESEDFMWMTLTGKATHAH
ncbi:hypothetical protein [Vibrio tubiashii]|nr:hypothetical protein [Vibrio tubiashii]